MVSLKPGIQAVLKKYGMKGTIAGQNSSTVRVTITKGRLDLVGARRANIIKNADRDLSRISNFEEFVDFTKLRLEEDSFHVNHHWIEDSYVGEVLEFYSELKQAMLGQGYFDESDPMTDYFYCSHYISINVGNKNGYQYTGEEPTFEFESFLNSILNKEAA